jgi:tmRNA-binding protein
MALLSPYVAFLFNFRALFPPTRHFAVRAAVDAAVNRTSAPRPDAVEYTWDAGLSLLPLEVKALRSKLCDLTASAVTCPSPSRAALTGVSFPGWAAQANAFGLAHGPSTVGPGGAKRELPLLLKRQQMRKLFASASSAALELHCIKIYFSETGWAKARIVAARKPLPPDHRRVSAERELRRRDIQDD